MGRDRERGSRGGGRGSRGGNSKRNRTRWAKRWRYREDQEGLKQTPISELLSGNHAGFERAMDGIYSKGRSPTGRKAKALEEFGLRPRGAPWRVGDSPEPIGDSSDDDA